MPRKPNLLNRKRGIDPRRTQFSYIEGLRMERIRRLRKNPKIRAEMDRYWADRYAILFK